MKRNRSIERALKMHLWYPPYKIPKDILPPGSVLRVIKKEPDWNDIPLGGTIRVGHYRRENGPNLLWLVDGSGEYRLAWYRSSLDKYFEVLERGNETDIYGVHSQPLGVFPCD